jgi:hypothetical protein
MQRRSSRRAYFSIVLIVLTLVAVHAGPNDIICHEYSAEQKDEALEEILYLSIAVEFANAGFSSTKTSDTAPYTLLVRYVSRERDADVALTLSERDRNDEPLANVSFTLALDFSLDARISEQVALLLEQSGLLHEKKTDEGQPSAIQGLFSSSLGAGMTPDEILAATAIRIDASVGAGGMVFLGKTTEYIHYGATVAASVAARKPWERSSLSVGIRVAATRAFNDDGVSGGPLYLSSAALDAQVGTGYDRAYRLAGVLSGGAAVVTVTGDNGFLNKTIPFVEMGALVRLPAGKKMLIGLDIRFCAAFDRDIIIMGFSPTLSVSREL